MACRRVGSQGKKSLAGLSMLRDQLASLRISCRLLMLEAGFSASIETLAGLSIFPAKLAKSPLASRKPVKNTVFFGQSKRLTRWRYG